ncbi:MAG: flagellin domain-containing protein [Gammaproteobacteria bacterium]|nr:MAG: flagellin domain-containing protein [Gammaproteobacteria bacterium]
MALTVNTNVASLNAQRNLTNSQSSLNISLQRLSSGLRVNSAKDDAAGLAIAERMNAQVRGLTVGIRNAGDGISLAQTAEGALGSVTEALQRMRELAVQSSNATNSANDRISLNAEYSQLATEVNRIIDTAQFNGSFVLAANAGPQSFQVGANAGEAISVTTTDMTAGLALYAAPGDILSVANAQTAIGDVDTALDTINSERATLGAAQSRIEIAVRSLETARENTAAARGRIMDADFAAETANLTRSQILQQAGVAMLSQANSLPQLALALLQ